jgi:hypothetical protein
MDQSTIQQELAKVVAALSLLEERVRRVETRLAQREEINDLPLTAEEELSPARLESRAEEFEYQVGQNWFAKAGIVVLTIGVALLLTFPLEGLPSYVPAVTGYLLVVGLFSLSRLWRESYPLLSKYLFGAALAVMYFATLRLFFFSPGPSLNSSDVAGILLLLAVPAGLILLAFRRRSPYLLSLSVTAGFLSPLLIGSTPVIAVVIGLLVVLVSYVRIIRGTSGFFLYGLITSFVAILLWGMNNPLLGNPIRLVAPPAVSIPLLLWSLLIFGIGILLRRDHPEEDASISGEASATGFFGYGIFLWLTGTADPSLGIIAHLLASTVFLGLAVALWIKAKSAVVTFIFAMFGYLALSVAIVKAFGSPQVFVWLSMQSVVVVATAVWFRSRFIVLANFLIYLVIIVAYVIVTTEETGIILVFGVVALLSARILNWQQHRLALKTDAMRNAYLGTAFLVFPYALYHLVPPQYVSLSWIGIALLYYLLNVLIKAQKYRWMGHLTLMITVLYVLVIGIIQMEPAYRLVSFLALAIALLTVSMIFTRLRARRRTGTAGAPTTHSTNAPP